MNLINIRIFIILFLFKKSFLSFLQNGINQLSSLIYLQRLSILSFQSYSNQCSFSEGPYCFYFEPFYIRSLESENQTLKKDFTEKKWISINYDYNEYSSYQDLYNDLEKKMENFYQKNLDKIDKNQKVPIQEEQIGITFERYDSITINNDIYLEKRTYLSSPSGTIPLIIDGIIKLKYDKTNIIVQNMMDYPSKTYAIIESNRVSLSLDGKKFRIISFYVRPKNRYSDGNHKVTIIGTMTKFIMIEGFNDNKLVFSTNYQFSYFDEKQWSKIIIDNNIFINKLVLPGHLEMDNISLSVEGSKVYNIESLFYNDPNRKTIDLISDNDI
jgi:hypothetical protein